MTDPGPPLVARTRRIADDVDLLAVAGSTGVLLAQDDAGLAGRGTALRIPVPAGPGRLAAAADEVAAVLVAIERHDEVGVPGCGPVAFAAFPFTDTAPTSLVVPALVVGRAADGTRWATTVAPEGSPAPPLIDPAARPATSPSEFSVRASRPPEEWCAMVAEAVAAMQAGHLAKVVLAREVVIDTDRPLAADEVARRLRSSTPSALVYSVDGLVGASPELLVSRTGDVVRSQPMAGTAPRTGDPTVDPGLAASLLASAKDRAEHQITIDMVLDTVLPFCSYVDSEPVPHVAAAGAVQHLASLVEGRLSSPPASVLALVAALHPTPAVSGWPRTDALALRQELEGLERGRYAGAVGWVDADGNGRFAVAIRGVELDGRRARVLAGNGIVADSDPATELAETRAKLQGVLGALIRP